MLVSRIKSGDILHRRLTTEQKEFCLLNAFELKLFPGVFLPAILCYSM